MCPLSRLILSRLFLYHFAQAADGGPPFATDDAEPSHHFAQEIRSPTLLLV